MVRAGAKPRNFRIWHCRTLAILLESTPEYVSTRMKGVHPLAATAFSSPGILGDLKTAFTFKVGVSSAHPARTMMLADLGTLLAAAPAEAKREDLNRLIVEENLLGKRTTSNRWLTARLQWHEGNRVGQYKPRLNALTGPMDCTESSLSCGD